MYGDVTLTGEIAIQDALAILRYLVNLSSVLGEGDLRDDGGPDFDYAQARVNALITDESKEADVIRIQDALRVLRHLVNLEDLPGAPETGDTDTYTDTDADLTVIVGETLADAEELLDLATEYAEELADEITAVETLNAAMSHYEAVKVAIAELTVVLGAATDVDLEGMDEEELEEALAKARAAIEKALADLQNAVDNLISAMTLLEIDVALEGIKKAIEAIGATHSNTTATGWLAITTDIVEHANVIERLALAIDDVDTAMAALSRLHDDMAPNKGVQPNAASRAGFDTALVAVNAAMASVAIFEVGKLVAELEDELDDLFTFEDLFADFTPKVFELVDYIAEPFAAIKVSNAALSGLVGIGDELEARLVEKATGETSVVRALEGAIETLEESVKSLEERITEFAIKGMQDFIDTLEPPATGDITVPNLTAFRAEITEIVTNVIALADLIPDADKAVAALRAHTDITENANAWDIFASPPQDGYNSRFLSVTLDRTANGAFLSESTLRAVDTTETALVTANNSLNSAANRIGAAEVRALGREIADIIAELMELDDETEVSVSDIADAIEKVADMGAAMPGGSAAVAALNGEISRIEDLLGTASSRRGMRGELDRFESLSRDLTEAEEATVTVLRSVIAELEMSIKTLASVVVARSTQINSVVKFDLMRTLSYRIPLGEENAGRLQRAWIAGYTVTNGGGDLDAFINTGHTLSSSERNELIDNIVRDLNSRATNITARAKAGQLDVMQDGVLRIQTGQGVHQDSPGFQPRDSVNATTWADLKTLADFLAGVNVDGFAPADTTTTPAGSLAALTVAQRRPVYQARDAALIAMFEAIAYAEGPANNINMHSFVSADIMEALSWDTTANPIERGYLWSGNAVVREGTGTAEIRTPAFATDVLTARNFAAANLIRMLGATPNGHGTNPTTAEVNATVDNIRRALGWYTDSTETTLAVINTTNFPGTTASRTAITNALNTAARTRYVDLPVIDSTLNVVRLVGDQNVHEAFPVPLYGTSTGSPTGFSIDEVGVNPTVIVSWVGSTTDDGNSFKSGQVILMLRVYALPGWRFDPTVTYTLSDTTLAPDWLGTEVIPTVGSVTFIRTFIIADEQSDPD
jgi:tetratricopeptide (TPR) repeat protein